MNEFRTAHRCPHCQDNLSGMVSIWNPLFVEANDSEDSGIPKCQSMAEVRELFRAWKHETNGRYECMSVACCCANPHAVAHRDKGAMMFDPQRHCPVGTLLALQKFLADTSRFEMRFE